MMKKFEEMGLIGEGELVSKEGSDFRNTLRNFDISKIKLISFDADKLLNRVMPISNKLFTPIAAIVFVILVIISIVILSVNSEKVGIVLHKIENITVLNICALYIMNIIGMAVHEFSHGLACKKFGGRVRRMGVMLFYLQPAAYCDVSGIYLLDKKYKKIITLLAGIISQWVISSLIIIIHILLSKIGCNKDILLYYALLNIILSLLNIIPFVKFDGYWILSTIMNVYNLRENAFEYLIAIIMGKSKFIIGKEKFVFVMCYGVLSFIFTMYLWYEVLFGLITFIRPLINEISYNLIIIIMTLIIGTHLLKLLFKSTRNIKQKYIV
jgi:putative peptide zinc metalloprotease protein